jgi:hypothetical protein
MTTLVARVDLLQVDPEVLDRRHGDPTAPERPSRYGLGRAPLLRLPSDARLEPRHPFLLPPRRHPLIDAEEDGKCLVPRPSLADDGVDPLPQPPGAGRVAEVVPSQPGQLGLAGSSEAIPSRRGHRKPRAARHTA